MDELFDEALNAINHYSESQERNFGTDLSRNPWSYLKKNPIKIYQKIIWLISRIKNMGVIFLELIDFQDMNEEYLNYFLKIFQL